MTAFEVNGARQMTRFFNLSFLSYSNLYYHSIFNYHSIKLANKDSSTVDTLS